MYISLDDSFPGGTPQSLNLQPRSLSMPIQLLLQQLSSQTETRFVTVSKRSVNSVSNFTTKARECQFSLNQFINYVSKHGGKIDASQCQLLKSNYENGEAKSYCSRSRGELIWVTRTGYLPVIVSKSYFSAGNDTMPTILASATEILGGDNQEERETPFEKNKVFIF